VEAREGEAVKIEEKGEEIFFRSLVEVEVSVPSSALEES